MVIIIKNLEINISDLLWADPSPNDTNTLFEDNVKRKCSYYFSKLATKQFLKANCLISLIRGHEVQDEG